MCLCRIVCASKFVAEISVVVSSWKVLNLKPLTDCTICSPHTECNHTNLHWASNCHSLSLCHEQDTVNTDLSAHTGTTSAILTDLYHTQTWLHTNKPVLMHTDNDKYNLWLWGHSLPRGCNTHSLICVTLTEAKCMMNIKMKHVQISHWII